MKRLLPLCILLFIGLSLQAAPLEPWRNAPLIDHLLEVNAEWACQVENFELFAVPAQFTTDRDRIQQHLQLVEQTLRARSTAHLSAAQKERRLHHLSVLAQYWRQGLFPENSGHSVRRPYFVDQQETHCAVGYLLQQDGADAVIDAIRSQDNFGYLAALAKAFPAVPAWAEANGFTEEELAWIQPGYSPVSRQWDVVGNGGGYDGKVEIMKRYNDNLLILAGSFTEMDGVEANAIIGWTGSEWTTFGDGLDGTVYDLTFFGGNQIIAVGDFSLPGDETQRNAALWDGENWLSINAGNVDGPIYAIDGISSYGPFFVGGEFTSVNGFAEFENLAIIQYGWGSGMFSWWNAGGAFSVDGPVYDLHANGADMLVAGDFSTTGTRSDNPDHWFSAGNLAYWNEAGNWSAALQSEGEVVRAVHIQNGYLYTGDDQAQVDVYAAGVWNPIWGINPLMTGLEEVYPVNGFALFNEDLYVYGKLSFSPDLGYFGSGLVGLQDSYGYGLTLANDEVHAAAEFQGELFMAGAFNVIDNQEVPGLASSTLLTNSIVDPSDGPPVRVWSFGSQIYVETTQLKTAGELALYNVQGQLIRNIQLEVGTYVREFSMDFQGTLMGRFLSSEGSRAYKLVLMD